MNTTGITTVPINIILAGIGIILAVSAAFFIARRSARIKQLKSDHLQKLQKPVILRTIAAICGFFILLAIGQFGAFRFLDNLEYQRWNMYSQGLQTQLSLFIEEKVHQAQLITKDPVIRSSGFRESVGERSGIILEQIKHYQKKYPFIKKLAVYNLQQRLIFSTAYADLSERRENVSSWLLRLIDKPYYVSPITYSKMFNCYCASILLPVKNQLNQHVGYLQVDFNVERFFKTLHEWNSAYRIIIGSDSVDFVYPQMVSSQWPNTALFTEMSIQNSIRWNGHTYNVFPINYPTAWNVYFIAPMHLYRSSPILMMVYGLILLLIVLGVIEYIQIAYYLRFNQEQYALKKVANDIVALSKDTGRASIHTQNISDTVRKQAQTLRELLDKKEFTAGKPVIVEHSSGRKKRRFRLITPSR